MQTFYAAQQQHHATAHLTRYGAPYVYEEIPARAERLLAAVQAAGLGPVSAPPDRGRDPLLAVHSREYVDFLQHVHAETGCPEPLWPATFYAPVGGAQPPQQRALRLGYYAYGVDSPILAGTWEAAYWSAQCAVAAADAVGAGEPAAYALCRPPGHHTGPALFDGFCYLNNAAIAARRLQARTPGARVAILDVDYHHGNGTQMVFYADPTVLFCSLHADPEKEYPFYWGRVTETGEGAGQGYNRNWPLPPHTEDAAYAVALAEALAVIHTFQPQYLVVSLGLDIAAHDPLGGFAITPSGFAALGQQVRAGGWPTVLVQEGGYLLEKLGAHAVAFLRAFGA